MTFIPMIRMAITQYGHNCNIQEDIEYQSVSEMYLFCLYQVIKGRYYVLSGDKELIVVRYEISF